MAAAFPSRPYLLEGDDGGLQRLWKRLKEKGENALMPGLTDTQLRNVESLWLAKLREWGVNPANLESDGFEKWAEFVMVTIRREFDRYREPMDDSTRRDLKYLMDAIVSGMFFDCLELYLRVLKERVRPRRREGDNA